MPKVSVITPIYKVEQYIERCIHSLMEQTLEDMEFIFVNDGTPDNSMTILESILNKYPHRKRQVRVVNHKQNQGVHWARKTGVEHAVGEYIGFCDPDDWCEPNMFEVMYKTGHTQNADIVVNNTFIERETGQDRTYYKTSATPQECLRRLYQKDRMAVAFWRQLIRRSALPIDYFDRVLPVDRGEDMYVMIQVYFYARSIAAVEDCLYHYCIRSHSLTKESSNSKEMFEMQLKNISMVENLLSTDESKFYRTMINSIRFGNKLNYRSAFDSDKEWFDFDRDSHRDIWRFINTGIKERFKTLLVFHNFYFWKWYNSFRKVQ